MFSIVTCLKKKFVQLLKFLHNFKQVQICEEMKLKKKCAKLSPWADLYTFLLLQHFKQFQCPINQFAQANTHRNQKLVCFFRFFFFCWIKIGLSFSFRHARLKLKAEKRKSPKTNQAKKKRIIEMRKANSQKITLPWKRRERIRPKLTGDCKVRNCTKWLHIKFHII